MYVPYFLHLLIVVFSTLEIYRLEIIPNHRLEMFIDRLEIIPNHRLEMFLNRLEIIL